MCEHVPIRTACNVLNEVTRISILALVDRQKSTETSWNSVQY